MTATRTSAVDTIAFALEGLVDHPHRRAAAAVEYLHRLHAEALHDADHRFARLRILIETVNAFEARGGGFAPNADDAKEAALRVRAVARRSA